MGTADYGNGITVVYLPTNQAYAVMWCDQVLRVFNVKADAHAFARLTCNRV